MPIRLQTLSKNDMKIVYLPRFKKSLNRLPSRLQIKALQIEQIFKTDPEDSRLKNHALIGKLNGLFAISVDYHYRIIYVYRPDGDVAFLDIGTHRIYH